jgi:sigma-B regulation protein RsbU (phosphoserine phosphatase)
MNTSSIPLLIVEDSPMYAEILLQLLPSLGDEFKFEVKWVDSAEKALVELDQHPFDLALLDYKLPGADGLSLVSHIQLMPEARRPAVIMLTGIGREEVAVEAMKMGAKDFLSKDHLDIPSLLRAINGALERRRAENALAEERALLRALMDNAPDHIYFKDPDSRFTHVSASHAHDLGLSRPEQAIGKTDADFFSASFARDTTEDERRILETGKPVIGKEERVVYPDGKISWVSATKVPLRDRQGRLIGLVGVSRDITESKLLAEELARTAGELALKNNQMQTDLDMAREIQEAFLPQHYPSFPAGTKPEQSALRFHHRYRPAVAIGGDFFDVLPISDTEAGVLICDVMGHGVRAALVTAILRALIEQFKPVAGDPGQFLTSLNNGLFTLLKQTKMPMFASAFYLVADIGRAQLRCVSAGHPLPCRIRRPHNETEPIECSKASMGPALGVFEGSRYLTTDQPLTDGDLILLYTDGLFEVENPENQHYGQERLFGAFAKFAKFPPSELLDRLLGDIVHFAGTNVFSDDLCVVAVETVRLQAK